MLHKTLAKVQEKFKANSTDLKTKSNITVDPLQYTYRAIHAAYTSTVILIQSFYKFSLPTTKNCNCNINIKKCKFPNKLTFPQQHLDNCKPTLVIPVF